MKSFLIAFVALAAVSAGCQRKPLKNEEDFPEFSEYGFTFASTPVGVLDDFLRDHGFWYGLNDQPANGGGGGWESSRGSLFFRNLQKAKALELFRQKDIVRMPTKPILNVLIMPAYGCIYLLELHT
jgi:hypothetical protein